MDVRTEEIEYCKLKVSYQADFEAVITKRDEAVSELRKLAIPGFRPGKAPDYAIKARCKNRINDWVAKEMVSQAYDDILFETKIKPIGQPKCEKVALNDNVFSCEMTITVKPQFELKEYKNFEIPRPHINRDVDMQIQVALQDLRMRFGDVEPYQDNDFVEKTDQITMDFEATIDGEPFTGSTAQGQLYTVGEGRFVEFDDNILGMIPGDEREFDITFPDSVPEVGGKTANFKVKVHMGTKRKPAPLDDELAKRVGMETIDQVKNEIESLVRERINNAELMAVRNQIINRLVEAHDFEVPIWLTMPEAQHLALQSFKNNSNTYNPINKWDHLKDDQKQLFLDQAKKNVKFSLILDSIREVEPETVLTDIEAITALKQHLASQNVDPDKVIVEKQKDGSLIGVIAGLRDEYTIQWLSKQTKLID